MNHSSKVRFQKNLCPEFVSSPSPCVTLLSEKAEPVDAGETLRNYCNKHASSPVFVPHAELAVDRSHREVFFPSTFNITFNLFDCTESPAIRLAVETNFTDRKEFNQVSQENKHQ